LKVAYDPSNLSGAERYMTRIGTIDTSNIGRWIEQTTAQKLSEITKRLEHFVVIHRGLGFFWHIDDETNAPVFKSVVSDPENEMPDLVSVTYWAAADALSE